MVFILPQNWLLVLSTKMALYIYIYVHCGVSVCKSLEKIIGDILLQGVDEGGVLI